jgi:large subunit ribosomal protein L25
VTFYAHENDFRKLVYTADTFVVELDVDNSKIRAIMQDIQFHPVTEKILHIDFLEVFDDKPVTVSLPVVLEGVPIGVKNGGNLMFRRPKIITKGLVADLPDSITIEIEHLKIGMFVYIKDIEVKGVQFLAPLNSVVVGVKTARAAIEEEIEEELEGEGGEGSSDAPASDAPASDAPAE